MAGKQHHKKKKGNKKRKSEDEEIRIDEAELDRFAGSSEEENEESNDKEEDDEEKGVDEAVPMNSSGSKKRVSKTPEEEGLESEEDENSKRQSPAKKQKEANEYPMDGDHADEDGSSDEDEDDRNTKRKGMSMAMTKILGISASAGTTAVVLSKTLTPLQKQIQQEKTLANERKEKRKESREKRELPSLHIPLSVATTRTTDNVSHEMERERLHRRVATRGVVALFNAIAQHQQTAQTLNQPHGKTKDELPAQNKFSFLDQIKNSAAQQSKKTAAKDRGQEQPVSTIVAKTATASTSSMGTKPQWNALQDDFMMNPKKNWDQDDDSDNENDDMSPTETQRTIPTKKKSRISRR